AEAIEDVTNLDRIIQAFPVITRPLNAVQADWRTALRVAAAVIAQTKVAFAAADQPAIGPLFWSALTCHQSATFPALVALDGWDELSLRHQSILLEALRPYTRVTATRVLVAARLASYARDRNPLFDPMRTEPPWQKELILADFDPADVDRF